ncbi:MAG: PAS domain S-box protein [Alphaproteobacteria bacterium]|nr:MAG: PAS domain S-box protein [Alphaproteobacteria bacterium]
MAMEKHIKILLIEDNPGDAYLIEEQLEEFANFSYEFKIIETLNEALSVLKEQTFDVILLDLGLPDSDGISTFLRIYKKNPLIPIIILTGLNDETIGSYAVKKGAQDFLVKGQIEGRLLQSTIQYSIERKKAEDKIYKLANVVESSNDAIITESLYGLITSWNKGAENIFGYSAKEMLGRNISIISPPHVHEETRKLSNKIINGETFRPYETSGLRKDGMIIFISVTLSPVFDISGKLTSISFIARDITESRSIAAKLRESEERYRIFTEQTGQLVYEYDVDDDKIYWTSDVEKITGYTQNNLLNAGMEFWIDNVHPEDRKEILTQKMKYCDQGIQLIGDKENFHMEYRFRRKDGNYIHIEDNGFCSQTGEDLIKILGVMKDVTEKKETKELLKRIEETRKKEIHHRIKNNLQVISSLLDLQMEHFSQREAVQISDVLETFRESQNRVISMALIHEELYENGGNDTLNFSLYLKKLAHSLFHTYKVGNVNTVLNMDMEESIFFNMDTAVPLGTIVNELVSNSLKHAFAGRDNGVIRIKLYREDIEECKNSRVKSKNEELKSTGFILAVSDNGGGIPESIDIENPDTLGIQLVNALVDQLDGKFELKRANGTEFTIRFAVEQMQ